MKINKRPAVTKVLLWTRELTGVGALIALGSQPLKGNWALLVKAVKTRKNLDNQKKKLKLKKEIPLKIEALKKTKIKKSPKRLVKTVFIEPLQLSQLL